MTRGPSAQTPEPGQPFEQVARAYDTWYETRRGQRADLAERALLEWLVGPGSGAETLLEVGCGSGHFAAWLERRPQRVVGLDRSPAMLGELRRRHPRLSVVLGDGHTLPFRDGAVDVTLRGRDCHPQSMEPRGSVPALGAGATRPHLGPRARQDDPVSARPGQNRRRAPLD